jgi:hypothetical protein
MEGEVKEGSKEGEYGCCSSLMFMTLLWKVTGLVPLQNVPPEWVCVTFPHLGHDVVLSREHCRASDAVTSPCLLSRLQVELRQNLQYRAGIWTGGAGNGPGPQRNVCGGETDSDCSTPPGLWRGWCG